MGDSEPRAQQDHETILFLILLVVTGGIAITNFGTFVDIVVSLVLGSVFLVLVVVAVASAYVLLFEREKAGR